MRHEQTEVLVIGAGPVGMFTALLLARAGVKVKIVDQETRTATRTYACALHPRTIKLLEGLNLVREVLSVGRRVTTVAFYEGETRRAEAKLSDLPTDYPFALVLPQSGLESLLEQRLKSDSSVHVHWNHQLSGLRPDAQGTVAVVDEMAVSAKGYIIPEMDWSVERTDEIRADYVIGADGPNSFVAKSMALGAETIGEPEFFAVYEFQSDWNVTDELRVVLDQGTTSVLWPLPENRFRWSFQLREEHLNDFPAKDRKSLMIGDPALERANREFIQKLVRERAPWFKGNVLELGWSTDVEFTHRVASRFGQQHCWLVGDAAHQTGPAGMQSMNMGLLEAQDLSTGLVSILRGQAAGHVLENYSRTARDQWHRLLGINSPLQSNSTTSAWVKERAQRILPCLPASGDDLTHLLNQLQLGWT